jgi:hypothetical protein
MKNVAKFEEVKVLTVSELKEEKTDLIRRVFETLSGGNFFDNFLVRVELLNDVFNNAKHYVNFVNDVNVHGKVHPFQFVMLHGLKTLVVIVPDMSHIEKFLIDKGEKRISLANVLGIFADYYKEAPYQYEADVFQTKNFTKINGLCLRGVFFESHIHGREQVFRYANTYGGNWGLNNMHKHTCIDKEVVNY